MRRELHGEGGGTAKDGLLLPGVRTRKPQVDGVLPQPLCGSLRPLAEGKTDPAPSKSQSRRNGWTGTAGGGGTLELSQLAPDSETRIPFLLPS